MDRPAGIQQSMLALRHKTKPKGKAQKKARGKIKYVRRPTGEGTLFQKIFEEALQASWPSCPKCQVCEESLGFQADVRFFSHVLAKQTYSPFRLWRLNIWLCCPTCHGLWDQGSRLSDSRFVAKIQHARLLKLFYYTIFIKDGHNSLPTSIEEVKRLLVGQ